MGLSRARACAPWKFRRPPCQPTRRPWQRRAGRCCWPPPRFERHKRTPYPSGRQSASGGGRGAAAFRMLPSCHSDRDWPIETCLTSFGVGPAHEIQLNSKQSFWIRKQNFRIRKQSFLIRKQNFWIRKQNFWICKQNFWVCKQNFWIPINIFFITLIYLAIKHFLIAVSIVLLSNQFFDCSVESFALKPIFWLQCGKFCSQTYYFWSHNKDTNRPPYSSSHVLFPSVAAPEKALFKSWFVHPGSQRHLHIYPSPLDVALFRLWETITRTMRVWWPKFPSLQRQLQKGHCLASHSSGDWLFRWEINNGGLSTQTNNHNGK